VVELTSSLNGVETVHATLKCFNIWEQWNQQRLDCNSPPIRDLTKAYRFKLTIIDPTTLTAQVQSRPFTPTLVDAQVVDTISGDINGQGDLQFPYLAKNAASLQLTIQGSGFIANTTLTQVALLNQEGRIVSTGTINAITTTTITVTFTNIQAGRNQLQVKTIYEKQNLYKFAYFSTETFSTIIVNLDSPKAVQ
jgi:hypothetical protein